MAAAADIGATALSADGAAPADMDELDRRLRALQTTQARRRGELDSYMEALQSVRTRSLFASPLKCVLRRSDPQREVEADDGGTETLVSFPDGFEEIVQVRCFVGLRGVVGIYRQMVCGRRRWNARNWNGPGSRK